VAAQDLRVVELTQRAFDAMASGRTDEATRVWSQLRLIDPDNPQALLHLGQAAQRQGNMAAALDLLGRAAIGLPKDAVAQLNLAFAAKRAGRLDIELKAYESALIADPYCYPAMLGKAEHFEKSRKPRQAARFYKDALSVAPPEEQQPPELSQQFAHARDVVRANADNMGAFLEARLSKLKSAYSNEKTGRFDECVGVAVGQKKVYVSQPSLLHYPGVPATQFYERDQFPWLLQFEAATETVHSELTSLLREDAGDFQPYVAYKPGTPVNQWHELNHSPRWSSYFLWNQSQRIDANCARCPKTAALIESLPLVNIPGYAPTAMFSVLLPHTRIPPHTGVTNARLVVHLPLIVPDKCYFRVGNDTRKVERGKAWVFDDSIEHEAWNDSDETRIILIIDTWNPNLNVAERDLVRELLGGMRDYYEEDLSVLGQDRPR
jgi:aspartyl/asparaginyl beta-hydroxylase (cupin superfamily)